MKFEILLFTFDGRREIYEFYITSIQEAKYAFKALLESANVEADWSWEQVNLMYSSGLPYMSLEC